MKILHFITGACFIILFCSKCKEEDRLDHYATGAGAPPPVTNVKIVNTPGGALITYDLPKDPNLSYVKAVYEIQPGVFNEAKSSYYTDSLVLAGYGDTSLHEVKLYSVGRNEKPSEVLTVQVKPLLAPVHVAFDSLKLETAFGGVKIRFQNKLEANLAIVLVADTLNNGIWVPLQTFYTRAPAGIVAFRGLPPAEKKFAIYLRDRWNNKSDTLIRTITPLFEEKVPKPFKLLVLPTDETIPVEPPYTLDKIWDDKVDQGIFASRHSTSTPQWFTVDLNKQVVISRMKVHQRNPNYTYTGGNVKSFELWGSNNPDTNGGWNNWYKIGSFESYKPSGLPSGKVSAEDIAYAHTNGEDFDVQEIPPAFRYVRFKTTATYGGGPQVTIAEISFWGQIQ